MAREENPDLVTAKYLTGCYNTMVEFPTDPTWYASDIRPSMEDIIHKHGKDEWKACVLTNEIHGHLGIFSLAGVKMGILALEYFDVGRDALSVTSWAGYAPPLSCLNDGIQVSTGATLGQGTIRVLNGSLPSAMVLFNNNGREILMTLKPEYLDKALQDIHYAKKMYGLSRENYWIYVRQQALKYWLDWDRKKIFDIEEIRIGMELS